MNLLLSLGFILFITGFIIYVFSDNDNLSIIVSAVGAFLMIFFIIKQYKLTHPNTSTHHLVIDLPEEYNQISKDISKPDTLVSYITNDTLHIRFK